MDFCRDLGNNLRPHRLGPDLFGAAGGATQPMKLQLDRATRVMLCLHALFCTLENKNMLR